MPPVCFLCFVFWKQTFHTLVSKAVPYSSRRRRGQKSPSAGRRRQAAKTTRPYGAKLPMGCTSSAVRMAAVAAASAARSSVLPRGKGGESLNPKTAGAVPRPLERIAFL